MSNDSNNYEIEYPYPNKPGLDGQMGKNLEPGYGAQICCSCTDPAGAHKSSGLDHLYWCMICGKMLSMKQIDTLEITNKDTLD